MKNEGKKKKILWRQYLGTAACMLIGGICGFFIARYAGSLLGTEQSWGELLVFVVCLVMGFYLSAFVQIVIHEGGHMVFGLLTGYRFSSFRIGNLMWVKENGKLQFKRMSLKGTGGQCLMVPPDMKEGRIPFVLYNLGGSLANFITALICGGLWLCCKGISILSVMMLMLALVGLSYALINGIPMRLKVVNNDGYNALSLGRDEAALRSFWVQLKANEQIAKGLRLKDMPEDWFTVPSEEGMKNSMTAVMGVFSCNRLMDLGKFEEADCLMAELLEMDTAIVGLHRSLMEADRIFCELVGENRPDKVKEMLDKPQRKFMKSMKKCPSILRTQYAYALLGEKNRKKAEEIKAQFEKIAVTYPYSGDIESEWELIDYAEKRYEEATAE